jgi:hypothetical protein
MGARFYTAPEVEAGETGSVQSDVFSLGKLLYFMLSGTPLTTMDYARPDNNLAKRYGAQFEYVNDMLFARSVAQSPTARFGTVRAMMEACGELLEMVRAGCRPLEEGMRCPECGRGIMMEAGFRVGGGTHFAGKGDEFYAALSKAAGLLGSTQGIPIRGELRGLICDRCGKISLRGVLEPNSKKVLEAVREKIEAGATRKTQETP